MNPSGLERLTLRNAVKQTLCNYFSTVGNKRPTDFYKIILAEIERPLLEIIIGLTENNQTKMALILGIARGTLRKKLKQYELLQ